MPETTYEEATRCPRCKNPGEVQSEKEIHNSKNTIHTIRCMSKMCLWYNTEWIVQVLSDGTIPTRQPGPKTFEKRPNSDKRREEVNRQIRGMDDDAASNR